MHCSPRKAAAGAMVMPTRGNKPSRTRFKMGGGNFPDLTGDGKVTKKDMLKARTTTLQTTTMALALMTVGTRVTLEVKVKATLMDMTKATLLTTMKVMTIM